MVINQHVIDNIKERVSLSLEVEKSCKLVKKGVRHFTCCPFHGEKTPSLLVDDAAGHWKCFGCGMSGDVIAWRQETDHLSFREAVAALAQENGIILEEREETAEEVQKRQHKESLYVLNEFCQKFFEAQMQTDEGKEARIYAYHRWGKELCISHGIGFAPASFDSLKSHLEHYGFSIDSAIEIGVLKHNDKKQIYDTYRNRVVIPIRDKMRRIIGFTARRMNEDDKTPKYINSQASILYSKKESLFGIDSAIRDAVNKNKMYLMEGAPDALRLKALGINNAVAALGTAYGISHFNIIKKYTRNIVFIPDSDERKGDDNIGIGLKAVIEAGEAAIAEGMNVSLIELPLRDGIYKNDADSYIKNISIWKELKEKDFIIFLAQHLFQHSNTSYEISDTIQRMVKLVCSIDDEIKQSMYIEELMKMHKSPKVWKKALEEHRKKLREEKLEKNSNSDLSSRDLYEQYGFYKGDNCYYGYNEKGMNTWSNFILKPLFHIKDYNNPKRLYLITNTSNVQEIIELKQEDLISLTRFKQRIEGLGNYIWLATDRELTKLKMYLYERTETAVEIKQLGWNKDGFYAWGNGIYTDMWIAADEYGICRMPSGNYYLPSASRIFANDKMLFQFERKFILTSYNRITLKTYGEKIILTYGERGIIGLSFYFASLFKDVIINTTKFFPILNLFGPKGSGKSELGHTLMSFFIIKNTAPNLMNSTIAALSDTIAQCANALVHIDEYKNTIELSKREFLKGLWDGTGRNRMNMDNDKKREVTAVDCAVILSGQEMPTIDIALFSRLIFVSFNKSEFTMEEKRNFDELARIRELGFSHISLQLLDGRKAVELNFPAQYRQATEELALAVQGYKVEDRILRNWAIPLACFRCLESLFDFPFNSMDLYKTTIAGILAQNKECLSNNELSQFWATYAYLAAEGEIWLEGDFRIDYVGSLKSDVVPNGMEFKTPHPILSIRKDRIYILYNKACKAQGIQGISVESLDFYLKNSAEYLGIKPSVRFKNIVKGQPVLKTEYTQVGGWKGTKTSTVQQAMMFDYEMLKKNFSISLETQCEV